MPPNELVVLSHLRWTWVWQRPQHLISRLAATRRTWFVEEPLPADVTAPRLCSQDDGPVTRVWLEVPHPGRHVYFDDPVAAAYADALTSLLGAPDAPRTVWLYTPLALRLGEALEPTVVIYDVMDDLASFKSASPALRESQRATLDRADVVFTGGRSLHRGVTALRPSGVHLFPSGVEAGHFAAAQRVPAAGRRPVAGYVGVIDERVDLDLIAQLAAALPDWDVVVVGPVAKIDPAALPQAPNLHYSGPRPYGELPAVLGGFDVALMPLAFHEATRSISPTKTLEYLAAGLPVVSTAVPDVVTDYGSVVTIAADARGFAAACEALRTGRPPEQEPAVAALLRRHSWDGIAARMDTLLDRALDAASAPEEETA